MTVPFLEDDPHRKLEWVFPYILDWHSCGSDILRFRAVTTVARWFDDGFDRVRLYHEIETFAGAGWAPWSDQHRDNVIDLLQADVAIDVTLDPARLGRFFAALHDGSLALGRVHRDPNPNVVERHRPGYAWCLGHWRPLFEFDPLPWPFWMFPLQVY